MNARAILILCTVAAALTGCAPTVSVATPPGFAVLEGQQEYAYRAASAEGVVLGVRGEKNEPKGNLDFWADALDRQLRAGGYVREGEPRDLRSQGGLPGREYHYTIDQNGRSHRFWIAVFVTEARVWVVEAGGDTDRFQEKAQKAVQKAIESLGAG